MDTNRRTIKLYWQQIRKSKLSFFLMLVFIPLASLLIETLLPYTLSQAIGGLSDGNHAIVRNSLILAACVGLVGVVANTIGWQSMARHESKVRTDLGDQTFKDIINKDMRFFTNNKVGALTSRYIDFIRSETTLQDLLIIRTLGFILSIGVGMFILLRQSWLIALIIFLLIVFLCLQIRWSMKKRAPWRHERKELTGEIHGDIADAITNNLAVKTFAGEKTEISSVERKYKRLQKVYVKDIGFIMYEGSARHLLMLITQIAAISITAYLVFGGSLSIATAVFILTYLQRVASQIFGLSDILNGYDRAFLEAAPMSDMLAQPIKIADSPKATALKLANPSIELRDVSYHYDDDKKDVISHVNLHIPAGQKVGLIGCSGAGKTTMTHLLLRFDDVTSGTILIDGQDIRQVTQESLRQAIAYVPQEPVLFHRSLLQNIAYGRPKASDSQIRQAIEQANAAEFIDKLPDGLDTLVGERGIKLSGGQRQRVAIARAILKDAPILVLDEATSALDSQSEKLIQDALFKLMRGRTSIVIAHRLSTISGLDRIIVMDNGRIVEDGNHQKLLKSRGIYAKLWARQSGGFIEE